MKDCFETLFFPGVCIYHFQIIFTTSGSMFNSLAEPARLSFSQKVFSALALSEFEMGKKRTRVYAKGTNPSWNPWSSLCSETH